VQFLTEKRTELYMKCSEGISEVKIVHGAKNTLYKAKLCLVDWLKCGAEGVITLVVLYKACRDMCGRIKYLTYLR
jgi:hypothetical protein